MNGIVTDLIGQVVEVRELCAAWNCKHIRETSIQCRGVVRAVYLADKGLTILVEALPGYYGEKMGGGLATYSLDKHHVRPVRQCVRCRDWDQCELLTIWQGCAGEWEHKVGEGCRQVKIVVNGEERWMDTRTASYERIVDLALMQGQPSVTYRNLNFPDEESIVVLPGQDVYLHNAMAFDVVHEGVRA